MRGTVGKRQGTKGVSWYFRAGDVTRRGYRTKALAQDALNDHLAKVRRGDWIEPSKEPLSVYLTRWLEATAHGRKAQSTSTYEDAIAAITASIGDIPLGKLTTLNVQEMITTLNARYAPRTVRDRHAVLKQALKQAVRWRLVTFNAADGVDLPRVVKRDRGVWSREEVARFLEVAESVRARPDNDLDDYKDPEQHHGEPDEKPINRVHSAQYIKEAALWRLLLDSGMRIGEAMALQWTDLDGSRVRIERTQTSAGGQRVVGTPKTDASRRTIPLEPETMAALRRHELSQKEERLRATTWSNQGWIFTVRNGQMASTPAASHWFEKAIARAGVPRITLHGLRRTMTVLWLQSGVDVKRVSARLGHTSVVITLDIYTSVSREWEDDAINRVRSYKEG